MGIKNARWNRIIKLTENCGRKKKAKKIANKRTTNRKTENDAARTRQRPNSGSFAQSTLFYDLNSKTLTFAWRKKAQAKTTALNKL